MFGSLGGPELILILVIALIVFGPRRLPDIGKSMGKMLAEFRRASNEFKRTVEDEIEAEKLQQVTRLDAPDAQPVAAPKPTEGDAAAAAPGGMAAGEPTPAASDAPDTTPPGTPPPDTISHGITAPPSQPF